MESEKNKSSSNFKFSEKELERLSQIAQISDKLKNYVDLSIQDMDDSSNFTMGMFWRKYKFTIRALGTILIPVIIFTGAAYKFFNALDKKFEMIDEKFKQGQDNREEIKRDLIEINESLDSLENMMKKAPPEEVLKEIREFRRKLLEVGSYHFKEENEEIKLYYQPPETGKQKNEKN